MKRVKKAAAAAMAMAMCIPNVAFAADGANSGSFDTSFDIYSPALTVSVPVNLDIQVNPFADSTQTDVSKFDVASNSIDIINASVDVENDIGIPVNATIVATITNKADGVITEYNTFTSSSTSKTKKVFLQLEEAGTAAVIGVKSGDSAAFDSDSKLDLSKYEVTTEAAYSGSNKAPITVYGALLSVDIAAPTSTDTTTGAKFSTDATKVTPKVGSFAVTGVANAAADWKDSDVTVSVTYDIRASKALGITTPTITTAPTHSSTGSSDLTITVPNVGESTVVAMALHNDGKDLYGDYLFTEEQFEVAYPTSGGTTNATITIKNDDATLAFLAGDDYKGEAQDFVIALSDGRKVVTTLTVN